jgi:hypothetical protein
MNEADTRVELRKASDALLDAGHALLSVMMVPPSATKAFSAAAPSGPSSPWNSEGMGGYVGRYALSHWRALNRYGDDGLLEIASQKCEKEIPTSFIRQASTAWIDVCADSVG